MHQLSVKLDDVDDAHLNFQPPGPHQEAFF